MANYIIDNLYARAGRMHDLEFCRMKRPGQTEWTSTTWGDFLRLTEQAACALQHLGAETLSKAVICTPNCPEALAVEFAGFFLRICGVPVYAYGSQQQFDFIASNSEARIIFAGAKEQYHQARRFMATHPGHIKHLILLCPEHDFIESDDVTTLTWEKFIALDKDCHLLDRVKETCSQSHAEDLASLIYTSGTTGDPKGVMLTQANFRAAIEEHLKRLTPIKERELSLCFLPMSHVFEKAWTFFCVVRGLRIAFNYDPRNIEKTLPEVEPNLMCCVPRFWEKIYTAIVHQVYSMNWLQRQMVNRAWAVGAKYNLHYKRLGLPVPWLVKKEYQFWDRRIFSRVRRRIGIPHPNFFPTAGAALSDKICGLMRKMGIDVIYGYGMTETTATVSCFPFEDFQIGTVGTPMPMVDVKISESGEILVKGPTVTPGYYKNPEENAKAFTPDGYLRTGDAGFLNAHGALVLTHRRKDLFKTSVGKYISPQAIEMRLLASHYIDQVAVIGDSRKYVSALIVPNFAAVRDWAEQHGITDLRPRALCDNTKVVDFIMAQIQPLLQGLANYEHIKKIALLPKPFSMEKGEVTNTLKLRRKLIEKNYSDVIAGMYPEEYLDHAPVFNNRHR